MAHSVVLVWSDTVNPASTTYNIYRATGASGSLTFTQIATGVTTKTYTDSDPALTVGQYTYHVTAVVNGAESPAASVVASIPPAAVTALVVSSAS